MDTKLFRAFTPYINRADDGSPVAMQTRFAMYPAADPGPTQWTTGGFLPITNGEEPEYVIDVQGAALLAMIQINEKILPASVQREKIIERIADIERRDQRKANKKDYAQVKDEVCLELLPKAFVRRSLIPILFMSSPLGQLVLVFTGSAKKADDVMLSLGVALEGKRWAPFRVENIINLSPGGALTAIAKGDVIDSDDQQKELHYGRAAVLKGESKQTISIKEKDMGAADIQALLKQGYDVTKLGVDYWDESNGGLDPEASVQISDKMIFTGLKVAAVSKERVDSEADSASMFINNTWIIARTAREIVLLAIKAVGGIVEALPPSGDDITGYAEVGSQDAGPKILSANSVLASGTSEDDEL